jgi:hypothetical protein
MEFGQFLTHPFGYGPKQPVRAREGIPQDDQVIGLACVFHLRVLAVAGGLLGLFQPLVHLIEGEITE